MGLKMGGKLLFRGDLENTVGKGAVATQTSMVVTPSLSSSVISLEYSLDDQALSSGYTVALTSGGLKDSQGNLIAFDKIWAVGMKNNGHNDMSFTVADLVDIGTCAIPLAPGGSCFWYAPSGGDGSCSNIVVAGTDGDTFDLVVFGSA